VFLRAPFSRLDLSRVPETLSGSCGPRPGIACRLVWDTSHDAAAAKLTAVYLAGPLNLVLRLAWVVFLALVARALAHRLINRITQQAADAPLASRLRPGPGGRASWRPRFRRSPAPAGPLDGEPDTTTTIGVITSAAVHEAATERRHQRAHALGSILGNAATVTIFGIAGAIALGDLGVNLAPVLASAGVVGVAVGFGAQGLVRDFLAGVFMLLEDQYGVGDVINIGDATGTVEAVSLRTTRLRDVNGVVWHLRNGALEKVGNESQGWARAVVDLPIPLEWDIPGTRQLMESAAAGMWRDRRWRKLMLEKPEVWGANDIADGKVVMRVAAKTLPLRQWEVARELRERVMSVLDSAAPAPGTTPPAGAGARTPATPAASVTPPAPAPAPAGAAPAPRKAARRPSAASKITGMDTERDSGSPDGPGQTPGRAGAPGDSAP
jgi:moderate conductance mechanosensitive channel